MRQVVPEYKGALHKELAVNAGRAPENAGDQNRRPAVGSSDRALLLSGRTRARRCTRSLGELLLSSSKENARRALSGLTRRLAAEIGRDDTGDLLGTIGEQSWRIRDAVLQAHRSVGERKASGETVRKLR